jgi:hypothetical protein
MSYSKAEPDIVTKRCARMLGVAGNLDLVSTETIVAEVELTSNISPCYTLLLAVPMTLGLD